MAALAYVLLPVTGTIALLVSSSSRVRFHGAQAIVVGLVWAVVLYLASYLSSALALLVWAVGGLVWLILLGATALGRDPAIPGLARVLRSAVATDER